MKLQRSSANPILIPHKSNPWENLVVCNPAVIHHDGLFHMLYRAAGDDKDHVIHFGLATSTDGIHFERQSEQPVFSPSEDGPDAGCVEDPRIARFNGHFYITYAYRAYKPGQYWLAADNSAYNPKDPSLPPLFGQNMTASGLLLSDDLRSFRRLGRITRSDVDDRDVILFPEKVGDRYALLHRPMQWAGDGYPNAYPAMWLCYSDDLLTWSDSTQIAKGEFAWENKIGGSCPPIRTDHGWFVIYHAVDSKGIYRVGVMMLDLEDPSKVIARTPEPIMEPEEDYEWNGLYPHGVVFPTANVVVDGILYVYYGAADQKIGVATADFQSLVEFVLSHPWPNA